MTKKLVTSAEQTEARWIPRVDNLAVRVSKEIDSSGSKNCPVFVWNWTNGEWVGASVKAWSHLGKLTCESKRENEKDAPCDGPDTIVATLKAIDGGTYQEPPNLYQVYEDVRRSARLARSGNAKNFFIACEGLKKLWDVYLTEFQTTINPL